jgi:hypothetical protein
MPKRRSDTALYDASDVGRDAGDVREKKRSRLGDATNRPTTTTTSVGKSKGVSIGASLTQTQGRAQNQKAQKAQQPPEDGMGPKSDDEGDMLDDEDDEEAKVQELIRRKLEAQRYTQGVRSIAMSLIVP